MVFLLVAHFFMLYRARTVFRAAATLALAVNCFAIDPATALEIVDIVPLSTEEPRFPATMRAIGVKEGKVGLVVGVSESGSITDLFVVECTRRAFAQSALKSVGDWTFQPATYNGVPFPSTLRIDVDFELDRNLRWQTFTAPVETNIAQSSHNEEPVKAATLEQLDSIPLPLEIVEPERWAQGQATIEFYIDELGNVRCPKLISGTNLDFGRAAMDAVAKWRFQPPVVNGARTNTLVRQTFHLVDGRLATSKPI